MSSVMRFTITGQRIIHHLFRRLPVTHSVLAHCMKAVLNQNQTSMMTILWMPVECHIGLYVFNRFGSNAIHLFIAYHSNAYVIISCSFLLKYILSKLRLSKAPAVRALWFHIRDNVCYYIYILRIQNYILAWGAIMFIIETVFFKVAFLFLFYYAAPN